MKLKISKIKDNRAEDSKARLSAVVKEVKDYSTKNPGAIYCIVWNKKNEPCAIHGGGLSVTDVLITSIWRNGKVIAKPDPSPIKKEKD